MPSRRHERIELEDDTLQLIPHHPLSQTASVERRNYPYHRNRPGTTQWALALLPLVAHFALSTCTAWFVRFYVANRSFGVSDRRASFVESDGSKGTLKHPIILQTDITTLLSVVLALTRTCGGAWCVAMCSRSAFLLLEKDGLRLKDLTWMLDWGLPSSFTSHRRGSHSHIVFITALVLLASLPAQYAAPILTGSIAWSPSHRLVLGDVPVSNISTSANGPEVYSWWWYQFPGNRDICRIRAAGLAATAWSTDATSSLGLMKRIVTPAKQLTPNSTLNNITLPYFTVHSLTWLNDLTQITQHNLTRAIEFNGGLMNSSSPHNPLQQVTPTLAIIPDEPYQQADWNKTTHQFVFPQPTKFEKKATVLALFANRENNSTGCTTRVSDAFGDLPSNVTFLPSMWREVNATAVNCYIFANITYSAGAALCTNCLITPGGVVVSGISVLTLGEDPLTAVALSIMPEVITTMAVMNISIPSTWNNIEVYTREMLSRSYSVSWAVVTDVVGSSFASPWGEIPYRTGSLQTPAYTAIPSTTALVATWRVVLWFGLQALLTLSGVVFLRLQIMSGKGLVVQPTLEWFLLDTHEVRVHMDFTSAGKGGVMRLTREEDFRMIRYQG